MPLLAPRSPAPLFGSELTVAELERTLPGHYARWLLAGTIVAALGYGAVAVSELLTNKPAAEEVLVALAALFAGALVKAGRLGWGAAVALTALWLDLHSGFLRSTHGLRTSTVVVIPGFIVGVSLVAGARIAVLIALVTSCTIPLSLVLGAHFGVGPGIRREDISVLVATLGAANGTAAILFIFLRTFGHAVQSMRRHAERAEQLLEASPDATLAIDSTGVVVALNRAAERLLVDSRGKLLGQRLPDLDVQLRGSRGESLQDVAASAMPVELSNADGTTWVEARSQDLPGDGGSVVVLRDIAERKRAEAERLQLQGELYHAQRMESIGRLASSVAHDFNNVLTIVGGYAELLARNEDATVRQMGMELIDVQQSATRFTRQLLAMARKDAPRLERIDLAAVVRKTADLLRRASRQKIRLELDLHDPCEIVADPGQIEQLLLNLATNAADAMPQGGRLGIRCYQEGGDHVVLEVSDDGVGMSQEVQARIFEPFYTTKEPGRGTGLGLASVERIANSYEARISVESSPGRGTRFTVRFPKSAARAVSSACHEAAAPCAS